MRKYGERALQVEVSLFIHATEDPDKVLESIKNIYPAAYAERISFEKEDLLGYYKNPITMLKSVIKDETEATDFLKNLLERLTADDKTLLSSEFEKYIDPKGTIYIRLDKQEALLNRIKLQPIDPIHIKIKLNFIPKTLSELESILDG